ncbi:MAG: Sau3AI family type II restriction endonuclease [Niallia sp.]
MVKFDDSNALSIKAYAKQLIGNTFMDVINLAEIEEVTRNEIITKVNNPRHKGGMGHLIEKYYFEYEINNNQEPDFPKAGLELKVTPYEMGKKGGYSAGERLVITMINYSMPVEEEFFKSHVYKKSHLTLLIHYLRNRSLAKMNYPINYVTLFTPPEEDLLIIQQDYQKIIAKIKAGRAHELSEGDTMYLGACTKGSTAAKSLVVQEQYAPYIKAPKRAFCFKQSYMTRILNKYVIEKAINYEKIVNNAKQLEHQTFEELIKNSINKHIGKSSQQLSKEFQVDFISKNLHSALAYRMLGVKSNKAEEFIKANIEVKAIRIEESGTMKESISFPAFNFMEFVAEEWEESAFYNTISSKRYLFVVYKHNGTDYILMGCQLWNMPYEDIEIARKGWEKIQETVGNGVIFTKKFQKDGKEFVIENNLPDKEDNPIMHIRPHAAKRYYYLNNGEIIGNNPKNGDLLPDGQIMTKQCFWLNNNYIIEILLDAFK